MNRLSSAARLTIRTFTEELARFVGDRIADGRVDASVAGPALIAAAVQLAQEVDLTRVEFFETTGTVWDRSLELRLRRSPGGAS